MASDRPEDSDSVGQNAGDFRNPEQYVSTIFGNEHENNSTSTNSANSDTNGSASTGSAGSDSSTGRRRGRPRGSGASGTGRPRAKARARLAIDADFLASQIAALHFAIAGLTRDNVWLLTEEEAKSLATASVHCTEAFDLRVDPRLVALSELTVVATMIYAPRLLAIRARTQKAAQQTQSTEGPSLSAVN